MYCDYYGFTEKPFNITPDPSFIFLSAQHNEAFAHLLYGIEHHVGFIALTGEVGTGKTTVIRTLLGQLSPDQYRTALIFNPCLSSVGLMQSINREYGLAVDHTDTADLLGDLNRFLLDENAAGRTVVLVVDEAQCLESAVLEQIRLISNLETARDKLIQIVLVGQPELRELLARPELRQLGQRIGVNFHLGPMSLDDTRDYIAHRLAVAGRKDPHLFSAGAVRQIYRFSGGLPRLINLSCDRALLLGYTREQAVITPQMAKAAIADVRLSSGTGLCRIRRFLPVGLGLAAAALLAVGLYLVYPKQAPKHVLVAAPAPTPQPRAAIVKQVAPAPAPLPQTPPAKPAPPAVAPPAPTAQPPAPPPAVPAKAEQPAPVPQRENMIAAFNTIAGLWRVPPVTGNPGRSVSLEALCSERGLSLYTFNGSLGALLRLGIPAILEVTLPGTPGVRYLVLTGKDNDRYLVSPPLSGRAKVSKKELESAWAGRAQLPWINHLGIATPIKPGADSADVSKLQVLLKMTGLSEGPAAVTYDQATEETIRSFQTSKGIKADGEVGKLTLMLLYRVGAAFANPSLSHKGGGHS